MTSDVVLSVKNMHLVWRR